MKFRPALRYIAWKPSTCRFLHRKSGASWPPAINPWRYRDRCSRISGRTASMVRFRSPLGIPQSNAVEEKAHHLGDHVLSPALRQMLSEQHMGQPVMAEHAFESACRDVRVYAAIGSFADAPLDKPDHHAEVIPHLPIKKQIRQRMALQGAEQQ